MAEGLIKIWWWRPVRLSRVQFWMRRFRKRCLWDAEWHFSPSWTSQRLRPLIKWISHLAKVCLPFTKAETKSLTDVYYGQSVEVWKLWRDGQKIFELCFLQASEMLQTLQRWLPPPKKDLCFSVWEKKWLEQLNSIICLERVLHFDGMHVCTSFLKNSNHSRGDLQLSILYAVVKLIRNSWLLYAKLWTTERQGSTWSRCGCDIYWSSWWKAVVTSVQTATR